MSKAIEKQEEPPKKSVFFARLKSGLQKTRVSLAAKIDIAVRGKAKVTPEMLDELEEVLLTADVGYQTTQTILEDLRKDVVRNRIRNSEEVREQLKQSLVDILHENSKDVLALEKGPHIFLMVGINGSGKTTSIGKLAQKWKEEGKEVLVAAGDTFRAAAVEQLQAWADRIGVMCVKQKSGSDPSAVAFDAVQAGVSRNMDIVLIDTAGRLQTNLNLMEELKKIKRVIGKVISGAPHQTLLVLDASIGQNSISQAKLFHEALKLDGLVMTKLDGTGKGGVLFQISKELKLPVRYIGVGEEVDDLQDFDPVQFVNALFEDS